MSKFHLPVKNINWRQTVRYWLSDRQENAFAMIAKSHEHIAGCQLPVAQF
jgi:hypothetical protein